GGREPVDLVDEEDVARLQLRQDGGEVLALDRRARDRTHADAELLLHDVGEARLAEPGRADEEDVVERVPAKARGLQSDPELLLDALLPDEVGEAARTQGGVELLLFRVQLGGEEGHYGARLGSSEGKAHPFLGRQVLIHLREALLGFGEGEAELDEGVASDHVRARRAGDRGDRLGGDRAELLLQLHHDALGDLAADAGDRLEALRVVERYGAAQLRRRRAGDDREGDLRPDARDPEQELEELALVAVREAVE